MQEESGIRRCARCGEPAVVVVRRWERRAVFGLVSTGRTGRLDLRCQSCGAAVSIWDSPVQRAMLGVASVQAGLVGVFLLVLAGEAVREGLSPWVALGFAYVGALVTGLSAFASHHFYTSWQAPRRSPVVPIARVPAMRFPEPEPARRCTCGGLAPATAVKARAVTLVPAGVDTTHTCSSCQRSFTVPDDVSLGFFGVAGAILTPLLGVVAVHPPGEAALTDANTLFLLGVIGFFVLLAWGFLALGVRNRSRHPVV
ncbi:MAG: hypothetical protein H6737_23650 [Alphaproteobacteria bacterium]|nr:hypothetical protein [Alphaproteobacteria bacterium]